MPQPSIVAGILALVVLATGVLSGAESLALLQRAGIAYFAGLVMGHLWNAFFQLPVRQFREEANQDENGAGQESSEEPATAKAA